MTSRPIQFSCEARLAQTPHEIAQQILDISNWIDFQGYGFLPGIKSAAFEVKTHEVVGSRIKVENLDGSRHVEEIVEWDPDRGLKLRLHEFSKPLSRLATEFEETWTFTREADETGVIREFVLHPRSGWTRPFLWVISTFLRKAVARHLNQLSQRQDFDRAGEYNG